MGSHYIGTIKFVTEQCCECDIAFAMTEKFQTKRRNDHQSFYCPRGHGQYYGGKSETQKLKEQLERTQANLEAESGRAAALESQCNQVEKSYAKMRARIKNGVCPCCTRTFQNLLSHMKSEHPEFDQGGDLKVLRDVFGLTQVAVAKEIGVNSAYISNYERKQPIPEYAETAINRWVENCTAGS